MKDKLKRGDLVWIKTFDCRGNPTICKRQFHCYQKDGSLLIHCYDDEYVMRYEEQDYGITWALTKEELK